MNCRDDGFYLDVFGERWQGMTLAERDEVRTIVEPFKLRCQPVGWVRPQYPTSSWAVFQRRSSDANP